MIFIKTKLLRDLYKDQKKIDPNNNYKLRLVKKLPSALA